MSSSRASLSAKSMRDTTVRLKADPTTDTVPDTTINAEAAAIAKQSKSSYVRPGFLTAVGLPMAVSRTFVMIAVVVVAQVLRPAVYAQTPAPVDRVTFQQAIDRAIANNPSTAIAAAGILRAEGLLRQARAVTML